MFIIQWDLDFGWLRMASQSLELRETEKNHKEWDDQERQGTGRNRWLKLFMDCLLLCQQLHYYTFSLIRLSFSARAEIIEFQDT